MSKKRSEESKQLAHNQQAATRRLAANNTRSLYTASCQVDRPDDLRTCATPLLVSFDCSSCADIPFLHTQCCDEAYKLQHECSNQVIDECSPCMNKNHMESVHNELQGFSVRQLFIVTDCPNRNNGVDQSTDKVLGDVRKYLNDHQTECSPAHSEATPFGCPQDKCDFDAVGCTCGTCWKNSGKTPPHQDRLLMNSVDGDIFKSEEVAGLPAAIQGERQWQPLPMLAAFAVGLLMTRLVLKISKGKRDERQPLSHQTSFGQE